MTLFNMGLTIPLPDPGAQGSTQFTLNIPVGGDYRTEVVGTSAFLVCLVQSPATIPANPPTSPTTFQYRALNTSFRSETATSLNNFAGFVNLPSGTWVLSTVVPIQ